MNSESATLLVSLGTSPAIVPEAFLFPGASFDQVHVLTTPPKGIGDPIRFPLIPPLCTV
jgi:hypothetical protein